ncbi:MAG: hypothetical protein OHK0021_17980 [Bryobacter sp.]
MTDHMTKTTVLVLCALLAFPPAQSMAQEPVFVPGAAPPPGSLPQGSPVEGVPKERAGIRILILEGEKRPNRLTEGIFAVPVVEVRDSNDRPVEGAKVTFRLPGTTGAGAVFRDGSLEKTFSTNAQGQAMAEGYRPNNIEGKFNVRVTATLEGETTETVIPQSNTFQLQADADRKKKRAWRKWLWIGGLAAGGAVTAYFLLRDSGSSTPVITVTPGPPVLGGR